jgi:hypothetical protein
MLFDRFEKHVWWSVEDVTSAASMLQNAVSQLRSDMEFYLSSTGNDPDLTKRFGILGLGELRVLLVSLGVQLERLNSFSDLSSVAYIDIYDLAKALRTYAKRFIDVDSYNPTTDVDGEMRRALLQDLHDEGSTVLRKLHVVNMQVHANSMDNTAIEHQRQALAAAVVAAETSVANIREASAKAGVAVYAEEFEKEAGKHFLWSWLALGAGVVFLIASVYFLRTTQPTLTKDQVPAEMVYEIIHALSTPLLFLSGAVFFLRLFATERHNAILNRHRALALTTFKTFVDGAQKDEPTRLAVLRSANETVFAARQTGYLRSPLGVREVKTPTISIVSDDGNER